MIKQLFLLSILLLSSFTPVSANSPPESYTYMISPPSSGWYLGGDNFPCFFKMDSDPDHDVYGGDYYDDTKNISSFGIAYQLNAKNEFVEIWKTKNWYSFYTYLSYDCEHLVRIGNGPILFSRDLERVGGCFL